MTRALESPHHQWHPSSASAVDAAHAEVFDLEELLDAVFRALGEHTYSRANLRSAVRSALAALETPEFLMEKYKKLGGPQSYNHYAVGWRMR